MHPMPGITHLQPPDAGRATVALDHGWRFLREAPDAPVQGQDPALDDKDWDSVRLPHDFSILQPFDKDAPVGGTGGHLPGGVAWYRTVVTADAGIHSRRVWIEFDGVYRHSDVWCNGVHLGHRQYGYSSFRYEIGPHLRSDACNRIAVRADNSDQPNCRWYSGSGIYRHVRIVITDALSIAPWGLYVTTAEELSDTARVRLRCRLRNRHPHSASANLRCTLLDPDDQLVDTACAEVTVDTDTEAEAGLALSVPRPRLWAPEHPALYRLQCELLADDGRVIDHVQERIGIRQIVFDAERGVLLNGTPITLKGGNIHHDGGCVGAAVPVGIWRRRLQAIKDLGANTVRFAHNTPAPEVLDCCDELGLMAMDEAFDKWDSDLAPVPWLRNTNPTFAQDWQQDIDAMVLRDRNHPCVIIWSVGNEVVEYGQDPEACLRIYRMLAGRVRELDPTRPVTQAFIYHPSRTHALHEVGLAEAVDILCLNYQEEDYETDHARQPDTLILGTETKPFFTTLRRGEQSQGDTDLEIGVGELSRKAHFLPHNPWNAVRAHDWVIGGLLWTVIDYFGEDAWPKNGWCVGLIDTCGWPKARSHYFLCAWSDEPQVRIQIRDDSLPIPTGKHSWDAPRLASHWNWPQRLGDIIHIETPSNCESVELLLNGESCGIRERDAARDDTIEWYLPYEPGVLEARGRNGDRVAAIWRLETTGPAASLRLLCDREQLSGDGEDVVHLEIRIVDSAGRWVQDRECHVNVNVAGQGQLLGTDNGSMLTKTPYPSCRRETWFGRALAIIRARQGSGTIHIRVSSEDFDTVEARIPVR